MSDLIALVLCLEACREEQLPADLGQANYAATLARLNAIQPGLGSSADAAAGFKPLTCSGLLGVTIRRGNTVVQPGQMVQVRITGLTPPLSAGLAVAFLAEPPLLWSLHGHDFYVRRVICNRSEHPWTGRCDYADLAAHHLLHGKQSVRQLALAYGSPTAFRSNNLTVPVPMPGLVFGSLVERWNRFATLQLEPGMRQYSEEHVAISRLDLHTVPVSQKNGGMVIGSEGQATYRAVRGDRYTFAALARSADFALYSGVGVKTTVGMGQCRRI